MTVAEPHQHEWGPARPGVRWHLAGGSPVRWLRCLRCGAPGFRRHLGGEWRPVAYCWEECR